ncbi:MAG: hypothetical protein LBV47_06435 [Bacteroidales bacterium]|jgi:hypothetical protein|nr:hypothetical protein [Bacteroidales bacterium]
MSEWLSRSDEGFYEQCGKWAAMLGDETARALYKWDVDQCAAVALSIAAFTGAFEVYRAVNSTSNRISKDETKKTASAAMRMFAASSVRYNLRMADSARFALGIRPRDTTFTPHPRPTSRPNTIIRRTANYFEHKVSALNIENGKASKPAGVYGVRFVWQVGGERPVSGTAIFNGRFSRRPVITVAYDEIERGKTVYYASCYENAKGEAGPWSPVAEAYIG